MNLDELHKVMKGDMTIDQACDGMTDDFEIGHVSHRADGDYRKVAQGKWVPVKAAGGQGQMGAGEKASEKPAEQKGEPAVRNVDHALRVIENSGGKIKGWAGWDDGFVVETENKTYQFKKGPNGYTQTDATMSLEEAKAKERQEHIAKGGEDKVRKENMERRITDVYKSILKSGDEDVYFSESNEGGAKRMLRDDYGLTPTETDRIYELLRYTHNGKQEKEEGERAEAAARRDRAYNNERYGVNQLEDAAAPARLTRDTKIRLSRIKREQTQDERRTYKIGEISEKTGLQKTANGWREVKKGGAPRTMGITPEELNAIQEKARRDIDAKHTAVRRENDAKAERNAAPIIKSANEAAEKAGLDVRLDKHGKLVQAEAPAGGKKTFEGSGSTKGHKWDAEKVGDKYISTHTWPDGRTDKTEITQKDYETMRTTQGGKSEAPKPASSKPSSELKYYEDMGDRVEELRSQMTTAGPEEKRRLIRESVDLQRRMQTAPFRPKKKR